LLRYNYLNLPTEVIRKSDTSIVYVYDAIGTKLMCSYISGVNVSKHYYTGIIEYENNKKLVHTDEGIVEGFIDTTGTMSYTHEYYLKDHLGNIRAVFKPNNGVDTLIQSQDYYAFGMRTSDFYDASSDNKYLYNGKELQDKMDLDWYDYGARFYDPKIGRFFTQDAYTEKYLDFSQYQYAANNPISIIDINGDSIWYTRDKNVITMHVTGKVLNGSDDDIDMDETISDLSEDFADTFEGEFKVNGETYELKTDIQLQEAKSMDDVKESDHLVVLANGKPETGATRGASDMFGGKVMYIYSGDYPKNGSLSGFFGFSNTRSALHEFGHLSGLQIHSKAAHNLMFQGGSGTNLTSEQRAQMVGNRNNINKGTNCIINPFTGTKDPNPYIYYLDPKTFKYERALINTVGLDVNLKKNSN
jgi:RHS repeat-associated protein